MMHSATQHIDKKIIWKMHDAMQIKYKKVVTRMIHGDPTFDNIIVG